MASSPLLAGGPPEFCGSGLLWWVADRATPPMYFAGGHGGPYVVVVPQPKGMPCAGSSRTRSCRRSILCARR